MFTQRTDNGLRIDAITAENALTDRIAFECSNRPLRHKASTQAAAGMFHLRALFHKYNVKSYDQLEEMLAFACEHHADYEISFTESSAMDFLRGLHNSYDHGPAVHHRDFLEL